MIKIVCDICGNDIDVDYGDITLNCRNNIRIVLNVTAIQKLNCNTTNVCKSCIIEGISNATIITPSLTAIR